MRDDAKPIPSQCSLCKRRSTLSPYVCAAFPGAIPGEIMYNRFDHSRPWIDPETGEPGDQGMPLAGSILFEPDDDADPDALRMLRDHLGRGRIDPDEPSGPIGPPPGPWPVRKVREDPQP